MKALEGLEGVVKAELPKKTEILTVTRRPGKPSDEEIMRVIKEKGKITPRRIK